MTDPQLHRDLGRVEGRLEKVEADMDDVKRMVKDMHDTITTAKGGWKTLLAVGGLSAALASAATKFLSMFGANQ